MGITTIKDFNNSLLCYPNPTNSILYLTNDLFEINTVKINNLQGQLLYYNENTNSNILEIDLSNYSKGLYLVTVNDKTTLKILKN